MDRIESRARWGPVVGALAVACALPVVAGCEAGVEAAATSPTPTVTVTADAGAAPGPAPVDDEALTELLASFDDVLVIEGLEYPEDHFTPPDSAASFYGSGVDVVEPAACAAFQQAQGLGTGEDLAAAGGDLVNPVGPLWADGIIPDPAGGDIGTYAAVLTRVFGDEALAASVATTLLESDCDGYATEERWEEGSSTKEHTIDGVSEVTLPGVGTPTVRIAFGGGVSRLFEADGDELFVETRDAWNRYVHIEGPYAIMIDTIGLDDEEHRVAGAIASFLDHMGVA